MSTADYLDRLAAGRELLLEARLELQAAELANDNARQCPECQGLTPIHDVCGTCSETTHTRHRRAVRIQQARELLRIRATALLRILGEFPPLLPRVA